ncbi:MAG: MarR family transcriptional regulator [Ignavibacteriaceae bacterium]|jgi:MarR family.|nr:MAG: transcriptional regulator [Chlorobi bacterium OLB4]MBW7855367.1 winged helix DNA-binding protein [Ignavibacteria bacterium]MEB2329496.1 MarR family transcriptional regulator [Ignavibacteriaceae bacterium]OQY76936.1 MAG: MarR family transcriptional regulator [Ignavibacteriales bacterium UTCHB1]
MKIEDAIKQSKFKNEYEKLVVNILYTAGWIELEISRIFKEYGITIQQYNILRILRGQYPKPATINMLIGRMIDKMSNASRLVDKLLAKKLVVRNICKNDRRKVDVLITQKGLEILSLIDDRTEFRKILVSSLNTAEAKKLNQLLDKTRTKENKIK